MCLCSDALPFNPLFISYIPLSAGRSQMNLFHVGYFIQLLPYTTKHDGWSTTATELARYVMCLEKVSTFVVC